MSVSKREEVTVICSKLVSSNVSAIEAELRPETIKASAILENFICV